MTQPSDINRTIVESLFREALALADEVRSRFDLNSDSALSPGEPHECVRHDPPSSGAVHLAIPAAEASPWELAWVEAQNESAKSDDILTKAALDARRAALSSEGLKTTTRMMYLLAWLLGFRGYFSGEVSVDELRNRCVVPPDRPSDPANLMLLDAETRGLIEASHSLHARVTRLDAAWRERFASEEKGLAEPV